MFLMSSKAPNTREAKLYNEHKSRNNHSVIEDMPTPDVRKEEQKT